MSTRVSLFLAIVLGAALWFAANLTNGVQEPWDGANFLIFYAVALLLSGGLGLLAGSWAWKIGAAVILAMLPVMLVSGGGEIGALFGLGMILLAVMALPAAAVAELAFRLRHRLGASASR
ncbi:MAG: hypothetical protein C0471_03365 [Erythrobacter sp.]|nr:hypothetical protein [Erythrobacter sp.]